MKKIYVVTILIGLIALIWVNMNYVYIRHEGLISVNSEKIGEDEWDRTVYPGQQLQLVRLKKLKSLVLCVQAKDDLEFLNKLNSLEKISLVPDDAIDMLNCSLETLPQMQSLKAFSIVNYKNEDLDCSSLCEMYNLERIYAMNSNIKDWSFISSLPNLKEIYIVRLDEYTGVKWDAIALSDTLEEFTARGIFYEKELLDDLSNVPTLKYVEFLFLGDYDEEYVNNWKTEMENRGVEVLVG